MSLTKIPFILLATWAFNKSATAPNPSAPPHERISLKSPMQSPKYVQTTTLTSRILQYIAAIAEIATILASANPSSPVSKSILSLVWSDGKPVNLRMSNTIAIGMGLVMLGTWIRLMAFRYLGRFFRFEASIQKDHELIVSGPYAIVRHPSYTGWMLIAIGWFPWQLSRGSWIMESGLWNTMMGRMFVVMYFSIIIFVTGFFLLGRMTKEDKALRKQFGTMWDDWAKSVPYSIFPGIY